MRKVVRDVCEPSAARLELLNQCKRLADRLVHGMRNIPKSIEDQFVESFQKRPRRVRKKAEVRKIRSRAKPETQNFHLSVEERHRNKRNTESFEWSVNYVQGHARNGAERRFVIENISEDAPDDSKRFFVAVDGQRRPLPDIEGPNVIEPEDVVGVAVRQQNGIEPVEPNA